MARTHSAGDYRYASTSTIAAVSEVPITSFYRTQPAGAVAFASTALTLYPAAGDTWDEIDKLRRALTALTSRGSEPDEADHTALVAIALVASSASTGESPRASARRAPRTRKASVPPRPATQTPASSAAAPAPVRTAPGATKATVLAALTDGGAMTAGEIAAATGLGRATVSTTLSELAGSGEITKAARLPARARERHEPQACAATRLLVQ